MRVEWTEHAKKQKDQVAGYIRRRFGYKRKKVFAQEIDETIKILMRSPNIGPLTLFLTTARAPIAALSSTV